MEIFKVANGTNSSSLAGAIANHMRANDFETVEVQAIGAKAVNQAIKAIAITRGFVAPQGVDLICIPAFMNSNIEDTERTVIKMLVRRLQ